MLTALAHSDLRAVVADLFHLLGLGQQGLSHGHRIHWWLLGSLEIWTDLILRPVGHHHVVHVLLLNCVLLLVVFNSVQVVLHSGALFLPTDYLPDLVVSILVLLYLARAVFLGGVVLFRIVPFHWLAPRVGRML